MKIAVCVKHVPEDPTHARIDPATKRLLNGVNVEWIERTLARPIEPLRLRIDPPCLLRDVLDADGDLHGARTLKAEREANAEGRSRRNPC